MNCTDPSTLLATEPHPMSIDAMRYIRGLPYLRLNEHLEILNSLLIENPASRTYQICRETLSRILDGHGVSDRYLLGLFAYLAFIEGVVPIDTLSENRPE